MIIGIQQVFGKVSRHNALYRPDPDVGLIIIRRCLNFLTSGGVMILPLFCNRDRMMKVLRVVKRLIAWMEEQTSIPSFEVNKNDLNNHQQ